MSLYCMNLHCMKITGFREDYGIDRGPYVAETTEATHHRYFTSFGASIGKFLHSMEVAEMREITNNKRGSAVRVR